MNYMYDVNIEDHGSIVLIRPNRTYVITWIRENVADPMWLGTALAVESRYVANILEGMYEAGFDIPIEPLCR